MSVLFGVLQEEKGRLDSLSKRYCKEIGKLPKGSYVLKDRKGKKYVYLNLREKSKVRSLYLGPHNAPKVQDIAKKIKRRQEMESWLKDVKSDLKILNKVLELHGRRKNQSVS